MRTSGTPHVLLALSLGMRAEEFDRIHHLPKAQLAAVVDGLRDRGLVDAAGALTALSADELDELIAGLDPIAAAVQAAGD